jgi:hypothetical protein
MSGTEEVKNSKMDELGPAAGYIVVAPTTPDSIAFFGRTWDPANGHPLLESLLEDASAAGGVDSDRVHVMGFSQGGFAAWSLLCRASTTVCSIAPLAASGRDTWGAGYGSTCFDSGGGPAVQRPIFYTTGRLDPLAPLINANEQRDYVLDDYGLSDSDITHTYHNEQYSTRIWSGPGLTTFRMDDHNFAGNLYASQGGHCYPRTGGDCQDPPRVFGTGPDGETLRNHGCCSRGELHWPTEVLSFFVEHPCSLRSSPTAPSPPSPPPTYPDTSPAPIPGHYCQEGYDDFGVRYNAPLGRIIVANSHTACSARCTQYSDARWNGGCKGYQTGMYFGMLYCRSYGYNVRTIPCADWAHPSDPGMDSGALGSTHARTNVVNRGGNCCSNITCVEASIAAAGR